ncbi:MAG TPA: DMT family transporter [Bryobacteraceae bacterium]|nr:DMT family transporter [Bryobacteraceae bacterium]
MGRHTNRLLLLAAAFLFSTGGAAIKATTLTSWQVAGFRSAIAGAAILVLVPSSRHGWTRRHLAVALAYAATMMLFVTANKLTTSANAIFLQDTAPLYMLLLGPWLLDERLRATDLLLAAVVGLGMALFFVGTESAAATAPDPLRGNVIAAVSGIAWALTIAGLRWLGKGTGSENAAMPAVVMGNAIAFLVCLPMALPVEHAGAADAVVVGYLGIVQVGLAYACLTRAMRHVPAFEASAVLLAEPALNPLWAYLVHGERPGVWSIAGGTLILAATLANAWWHSRRIVNPPRR